MTPQRPTTLKLFCDYCPAALDAYEKGVPYDRRIFAPGIAAHAILQQIGLSGREAVDATCKALMALPREGIDAEPPMSPDDVFAGRDLAVGWAEVCDWRLGSDRAQYEVGFGFREGWVPCSYMAEDAWYRMRLDVVDVIEADEEEDEILGVGLVARDYKGWPGSNETLDTVQLRSHAVAIRECWSNFVEERPEFIRLEVVNLQLRTRYHRDINLDDEAEMLDQWKRDITATVDAAQVRPRVARPGLACVRCPYVLACKASKAFARSRDVESMSPRHVAERYAILLAEAKEAEGAAREAVGEGAIDTPEGRVGWLRKVGNEVREEAPVAILDRWLDGKPVDDGLARGLLTALGLGVTQVKHVSKALFPGRKQKAERDAWAAEMFSEKVTRQFGIQKTKSEEENEDE